MLTNYFYIEMKKILFGALCASAFLASCSNDELELNSAIGVEGGEKIEVLLGATYPEYVDEANTRMTLVGNEWAWINGDMLGGCMINSNNVVSNYPFFLTDTLEAPTKNVTFKTNTAVYAGDYIFYHQYKTDLISGTYITVNFPILQVIDPENPTAHVSEQNMWVSPKIKLGGIKYGENNKTAIKFVGMNAVLKLNITNNSDYDKVVINKVVVNGTTGAFCSKGTLDVAGKFSTALTASDPTYATSLDGAIETMNKASETLITSSATVDDISAIISGEGISLAQDAEATVYVLIPAGQYGVGSSKDIQHITVYTDKGYFQIAAQNARSGANKGTEADDVDFNRNSVLNLYPELEGKASDVETYDVNNEQDWDNAVAYALANTNKTIEFNLVNALTIDELPNCALYVTGKDLTLKEGKEYNLYRGSEFASIINKGTLNLVDNVTVTKLVNKGTVKIAKTEEITGSVVTTLTNNGTIDLEGSMTTASGWTNVYKEADKVYGTINVKSGANLIIGEASTPNAGIIDNAGTITLTETLNNTGKIEVTTATGKFVGDGTKQITNSGAIKLDAIKDVFVDADGEPVGNSFIATDPTGTVEVAVSPSDIATLPAIQEINAISMSGSWTIENVTDMNAKWDGITAMTWEGVSLDLNEVNDEFQNVVSLTINGTSAITTSGTEKATMKLKDATGTTITVKGDLTIGKNVAIGAEQTNAPEMTVLGSVINNGKVYVQLTVGAAAEGSVPANTSAKFTNTKDATTDVVSGYSGGYSYADALILYGIFVNEGDATAVNTKKVSFMIAGKSTFTGSYTQKP